MVTTFQWDNLNPYIDKVSSLVKNSKNLQRDFLKFVGIETLDYLRKATPKESGDTARAWSIEKKSTKSITIGNSNEEVLLYILKGHRGGQVVQPQRANVFRFEISGQEFFRVVYTTRAQLPYNFMEGGK